MKKVYGQYVEEGMIIFYDSLSEKDKRRYAAIEAQKLPYGGQKYISDLLCCDPKTIQKGISELENEALLKKKE